MMPRAVKCFAQDHRASWWSKLVANPGLLLHHAACCKTFFKKTWKYIAWTRFCEMDLTRICLGVGSKGVA